MFFCGVMCRFIYLIITRQDWDTSKVTDLYETFSYAESFTGDISTWDVSKVKKMSGTFNGALKEVNVVVYNIIM